MGSHVTVQYMSYLTCRQAPYNYRLKQPAKAVTPLAHVSGGPGTDPGYARVAPGLAAD